MTPLRIVLSGMMAANPHQGGATWAVLQDVFGLRALGHEVCFVEPVLSGGCGALTINQARLRWP